MPVEATTQLALQRVTRQHFGDGTGGGFCLTADDAEQLLARPKESYDGAIPAGNSAELLNLIRLTKSHLAIRNQATAYVCTNYVCKLPVSDPGAMVKLLRAAPR